MDITKGIIWCANCLYFKETGSFTGLCFYNPPTVTDSNPSLRPVVTREEFCSKFEEYP